jgi:AcrR family transcriptional regulator
MPGRRSDAHARDTRDAILRHAADLGSVDGLEGLTIGRLAGDLEMSKAGVLGHFGSKEELQLATLDLAVDLFRDQVWEPVSGLKPGLERLLATCDAWVRYADAPTLRGGCFIAAVSFEWDGRTGRVHDAIAEVTARWRRVLIADIEQAVADGDLPADTDPAQVAFSLEALAAGMNPARQLHGDADTAAWSLKAMYAVLGVPAPARAAA